MNHTCRASGLARCAIVAAAVWTGLTAVASADEPALHQQIDALVAQRHAERHVIPAARSSDAEFVRRAYLDLTGVIPTTAQARAFLDDAHPDKRAHLIDALLASPDSALHLARTFDVMLTERRVPAGGGQLDVPTAVWRAYLAEAFAENRPWDQIVRELLASDGTDERLAGAAKFYLVRDVAPHQLTRDVGRLFLGIDLQCAQCHDDPRVEAYRQADYFGIYAFLQRMKVHPVTPRGAQIAETADGKTTFVSVFTTKSGETAPRLPGGEMLADPPLEAGKEYVVKPAPKERAVPTYSRRLKLAEQLPRAETQGFTRNIANRLWSLLFGRGLVHPLDLHHPGNPPAHPALLEALERWLAEHRYDIRSFLREIALSETYQRASVLPSGAEEPPVDAFAAAPLRGLNPEQLRWSLLQATGRIELHESRLAAQAKPADPAAAPEPAWKTRAARHDALERQTASLVAAFAGLPGQPEAGFQPVVDQALYLRNSAKLLPLLQAEPGTLLARLQGMSDAALLAEELYLSVLSRRPTSDEAADVQQLLTSAAAPAERGEALQALVWGLLLSAEFRLIH